MGALSVRFAGPHGASAPFSAGRAGALLSASHADKAAGHARAAAQRTERNTTMPIVPGFMTTAGNYLSEKMGFTTPANDPTATEKSPKLEHTDDVLSGNIHTNNLTNRPRNTDIANRAIARQEVSIGQANSTMADSMKQMAALTELQTAHQTQMAMLRVVQQMADALAKQTAKIPSGVNQMAGQ
jgi:hypothetical protein